MMRSHIIRNGSLAWLRYTIGLYYWVILWFFITENALNILWTHILRDSLGLGWLRYIFLLNGYLPEESYFGRNLGATWTIPVFVFFYLIAPWVMKLIKSYKSSLITLLAVFITTRIFGLFYSCPIIERIHYFFIGILIYYCWKDGLLKPCSLGFLAVAIVEVILEKNCYSAIFTSAICISLGKDTVFPEKVQRVIDVLDEHSYALYLVHGAFFCSIIDRLKGFGFFRPNWIVGMIAVVGSVIGTVLVHCFVEKPLQKLLKRKLL